MPAAPWEWMNPVVSEKLTGRKSARRQKWTDKLILRVEIEQTRRPMFADDDRSNFVEIIWRDAKPQDFITYEFMNGKD